MSQRAVVLVDVRVGVGGWGGRWIQREDRAEHRPAYAEDSPDSALAPSPSSTWSLVAWLAWLALLPFRVTKTTPKANTGREPHCMGVRYCPSSHTAKTAVGMILKLWEQIWKVTASRCEAATITSTCTSRGG